MKKKVWAASPVFFVITVVMLLMAAASWSYNRTLFYVEISLSILAVAAVAINIVQFKAYVRTVQKSAAEAFQGINKDSMSKISLPVVVVGPKNDIVWYNTPFLNKVCAKRECIGESIVQFTSGLPVDQLLNRKGLDVSYQEKRFTVFGMTSHEAAILYFIEDTYYKETAVEYEESRPCVALAMFDNREELARDSTDSQDAQIVANVERTIQDWAAKTTGFYKKISGGRYMVIMEERHLRLFIEKKFEILDQMRNIKLDERRYATISIGIGRGGKTMKECETWARNALEMALGRGGDQVAIKRGDSYEFFGGVSKGVEKRDKVRTRVIASTLSDHIKDSDYVFIMGHQFSDLDSVGAAVGMWSAVTKGQEKPASVVINREQSLSTSLIESIEKSGNGGMFITPAQAENMLTDRSLLIIVDTHSPSFVESVSLYQKSKRVVVIDHHRMMVNHIEGAVVFYHEPYASSASEMVTELTQYLGENALNRLEAEALLAGIMLDTKNFVLKTGVRTFEAAAYLRRKGADTVEVKRLFSDSIDTYKAKYQMVSGAEIFNSCAIASADENCSDIRVASAQAADELLGIQGVNASFVMYPAGGGINISARSLGSVNVQVIMEALGGGGHQTMAGAQLPGVTMEEAREKLVGLISDLNFPVD